MVSGDERALVLEHQPVLVLQNVDLARHPEVLMRYRVVQKLSDDLEAIAVRLDREQRVLAVEEAIFLVPDLAEHAVDLHDEGRLKVLACDGRAVARVERPGDARLYAAQEHACLRLAQKDERGVRHVSVDDEPHLAQDGSLVQVADGWLALLELLHILLASERHRIGVKVVQIRLERELARPVMTAPSVDGLQFELGYLDEGLVLTRPGDAVPGGRCREGARGNLEGDDALALHLEFVYLLKGHTLVGELRDLALEAAQPDARNACLFAIYGAVDLPVVRDAEEEPPAFRAA